MDSNYAMKGIYLAYQKTTTYSMIAGSTYEAIRIVYHLQRRTLYSSMRTSFSRPESITRQIIGNYRYSPKTILLNYCAYHQLATKLGGTLSSNSQATSMFRCGEEIPRSSFTRLLLIFLFQIWYPAFSVYKYINIFLLERHLVPLLSFILQCSMCLLQTISY